MKTFFKNIVLSLLFANYISYSVAQEQGSSIKELKIGDRCPDFEFANIINYPKTFARLSDFKDKLVILDFWATWCGPCVTALSGLDSLQKQFKSQIVIIPVTYEETEKVRLFIQNSKTLKNIHLPSITQDTTLLLYFRRRLVPHEVWINGSGVVTAISAAEQVTAKNIQDVLDNKKNEIITKQDIIDSDESKPFLLGGLGKSYDLDRNKLKFSSILTTEVEGLPSAMTGIKTYGEQVKLQNYNSSIAQLYENAIGATRYPDFSDDPEYTLRDGYRTIWEAKDSSLTYNRSSNRPPVFCYELILPKEDSLIINTYALKDLNRYFGDLYGMEGVKEKRKVKCWVLVKTREGDLVASKGGKPDIIMNDDLNKIILKNYTISKFLFLWVLFENSNRNVPVLDETAYKNTIDLDITTNIKDIESLSHALEKYGLAFKLVDRELDMIIIRDKKN